MRVRDETSRRPVIKQVSRGRAGSRGWRVAEAPLLAQEPLEHLVQDEPELVETERDCDRRPRDQRNQGADAADPRLPLRFGRGKDRHVDDRLWSALAFERRRRRGIGHLSHL
jgi:hypothetical protein